MPAARTLFDDMVAIAEHLTRTTGGCPDEVFQRFNIPGIYILAYGPQARREALDRVSLACGIGDEFRMSEPGADGATPETDEDGSAWARVG